MERPLVIIMGCGCDPEAGYVDYAAKVAVRLRAEKIIATGGFTNPRQFPNTSEAGAMKARLVKYGINSRSILLENKSFTTNQNLRFCQQIIDGLSKKPSLIYIICDSIREIKIKIIASQYFANYRVQVLGFDFHRSSREKFRQIFATIKDIIALWFPFVEDIAVWLRKRAWGIK